MIYICVVVAAKWYQLKVAVVVEYFNAYMH